MSKLTVDQKSIKLLLTDKHADFLIPDYQRPYAWGEDECTTLWDDLFSFAFPNDDSEAFNREADEYFLGPIVTFKNDKGQLEIIDGQQRLTTIMLLLRAFYDKFANMKDKSSIKTRSLISGCVWKTDEFDEPNMNALKIDSEVASDEDKDEFLAILRRGEVQKSAKSSYAKNYALFADKIERMASEWPSYIAPFAARILNNVILLPIEAESQDTALRIFSTLNDRGLPLADADIFKSQFYKYYTSLGQKDEFIARWRRLEETAGKILKPAFGTPLDELFTRYMYYRRALEGIRNTTTSSLRDFYSRNSYKILREDSTLGELESLLEFWRKVEVQESFSDRVLRRLYVLNFAPNAMWTYMVSTWFLARRNQDDTLDEPEFYNFLCLITGFIYAFALERPGVNALRVPVYPALIDIVNGRKLTFNAEPFDREVITGRFKSYQFTNFRRFTRSMLVWWAYTDPEQELFDLDTTLEIEHIYARKRNEINPLSKRENLEALGNKAILEKGVNIRASDYQFKDKRRYYLGFTDANGKSRRGTRNHELIEMSSRTDFTETDIEARTDTIIDAFVDWIGELGLLRE